MRVLTAFLLLLSPAASLFAADPPAATAPAAPPLEAAKAPAETMASRELRAVMDREAAIWARLRAQPDDEDLHKRAETEFRDVLKAYENLLLRSPENAEAYAAYGLLLNRTGNREQAMLAFVKANKLDPNLPMVKNQLGNMLFEDGSYEEALAYYLSAIELAPNEPLYHYSLGSLLHEYAKFFVADGIFTRAALDRQMLAAFARAAELAPDTWAYTYRHAEAYYDLATPDWPAALTAWENLEKRANGALARQTIQLQQANVLIKLGRLDEARTLVDSVTEPALSQNKTSVLEALAEATTSAKE